MASNASQITEIMEELVFQKTMLASIDDTVADRDDAEEEIRGEIRKLEKRLKELKRGPSGRHPASQLSLAASPNSPLKNASQASSSAAMEGYQRGFSPDLRSLLPFPHPPTSTFHTFNSFSTLNSSCPPILTRWQAQGDTHNRRPTLWHPLQTPRTSSF